MNCESFSEGHSPPELDKTLKESRSVIESGGVCPPAPLGRFIRQSLLGQGGCGAVYRAFDLKLNREVALKIPLQCVAGDARAERAFRREVYATSRLRHPYVVTLFDYEFNESEAILVYEFVDGETLHSWITKHPSGIEPTQAAEVVKKIALALQHAHSQNILHRDIKPSNILLDQTHASVSDSLEPRLADFGLAQLLHDRTRTESNHQLIGSIHYMPPEVIHKSADVYSHESDVYSLGTVLYELMTGQRPFTGSTIAEVLQKIGNGDFVMPRKINPALPRDLEAICLRAMSISPKNRYLTAELFAQDLDRFLTHRPVAARHPGVSGIFSRWARRNPTLGSAIALSTLAIVGFIALLMFNQHQLSIVNQTITDTNLQLSKALKASQLALFHNEQMSYCAAMKSVSQYIDVGRLRDARTVLNQFSEGAELGRHRDFEWQFLQGQTRRDSKILWQAKKAIYCVIPHGDQLIAAGAESQVTIIDAATQRVAAQWDTKQGEINGLAIDVASHLLFSAGDDGTIVACNLSTGAEQWRVQAFTDQRAYDLAYCDVRKRLYCLGHLQEIAAVDTTRRQLATNWTSPFTDAATMRLWDEKTLIVVSKKGSVIDVSPESGEIIDTFVINKETSLVGVCRVNSHQMAIATNESLVLYDRNLKLILQTLPIVELPSAIAFDSHNLRCVVAMEEGGIHQFTLAENGMFQVTDRWVNQGDRLYQVAALPEGMGVVSADHSGAVRCWDDSHDNHRFVTAKDADLSSSVDILPLVSGSEWPEVVVGCQRGALLYNFNLGSKRYLDKETPEVTDIKHWPGQLSLLSSFRGSAILLHHRADGDGRILSTRREPLGVHSHAFVTGSRDGRWIGGGSQPNDWVWLKDVKRNLPIVKISALNPHVLAILPESNAVYWNNDTTLHFSRLSRPEETVHRVRLGQVPDKIDVSSDGSLIALALSNREVRLWDARAERLRSEVLSHPNEIAAIAFTPSGRSLVTFSIDATLRCWNIQTGQLTLEKNLLPKSALLPIGSFSFTSDLRYVAFRPADRSVHILRLF